MYICQKVEITKLIRFVQKEVLNTDFYIVIILCQITEYVNVNAAQK